MTEKKYRMVALDLDGTLLGHGKRVSDATVEHLRKLHDKGFIISIATGRSAFASAETIDRLDFNFSTSALEGFPLVCTNGAKGVQVRKSTNEEAKDADEVKSNPMTDGRLMVTQIFHNPVSLDLTKKTLALAKSIGCVTNYYVDHDVYAHPAEELHHELTSRYSTLTGVTYTYRQDEYEEALARDLPSKLLILCEENEIDSTFEKVSAHLGEDAMVIRGSPPFFVEVLDKNVCKGKGLEKMCAKLNVDMNECISFGDGDNDIEFLQMCGLGFAMKNARDNVKKVADGITEHTNMEDGVIRTLQKLEEEGRLHFEC